MTARSAGDAGSHAGAAAPVLGLAEVLCFAATPAFAAMALTTGLGRAAPMDMVCSIGHGSPLSGMVPMYALMSLFHAQPWLKLISKQRMRHGDELGDAKQQA